MPGHAELLRNEAMLIWESCRRAGQKELLARASSLAKGTKIPGYV
jgi:hypothetical protein